MGYGLWAVGPYGASGVGGVRDFRAFRVGARFRRALVL